MKRIDQLLLIASYLPFCWLAMMAVHELGHVLGAFATGGQVARVVLHPLAISRTDLVANPHPMWTSWAGPLFGMTAPMFLHVVFHKKQWTCDYLVRFFAGFCLIANGMYIGIGSFGQIGDAGDLLRHGSPIWLLWLFGIATVPAGTGAEHVVVTNKRLTGHQFCRPERTVALHAAKSIHQALPELRGACSSLQTTTNHKLPCRDAALVEQTHDPLDTLIHTQLMRLQN